MYYTGRAFGLIHPQSGCLVKKVSQNENSLGTLFWLCNPTRDTINLCGSCIVSMSISITGNAMAKRWTENIHTTAVVTCTATIVSTGMQYLCSAVVRNLIMAIEYWRPVPDLRFSDLLLNLELLYGILYVRQTLCFFMLYARHAL